jgi:hypothetical protein
MHNAPSVSYPVGRCAFQRGLLVGFTVLTVALLVAWALNQGVTWVWCVAAGAAWLAVHQGLQALRHTSTLTWDGQVWCLHDQNSGREDALGEVHVALDVQKALLLRWLPTSDTLHAQQQWLWLGSQPSDNRWQDLRRAVYQRANR